MTKTYKDLIGKRIEIPVHFDTWARGARFGEITAFRHGGAGESDYFMIKMDNPHIKRRVRIGRLDWDYATLIHNYEGDVTKRGTIADFLTA